MLRSFFVAFCAIILVFAVPAAIAQQSKAPVDASQISKLGKGKAKYKRCSFKCSNGQVKKWKCEKSQPCCAWDAICYVKCGTAITGCL